jgi:hypothetical protein
MTDLDLPPAYRTQANLWQAKYFAAYKELVKANKGIRRLKRKLAQVTQQADSEDLDFRGIYVPHCKQCGRSPALCQCRKGR